MTIEIIVYILTDNLQNTNITDIETLFSSDPNFTVKTMKIEPKPGTEQNAPVNEANRLRLCMLDAERNHPTSSFVILKDNSFFTTKQAEEVCRILKETHTTLLEKHIPLCYLCKWNEYCDSDYSNRRASILRNICPDQALQPIQALMITPDGRSSLLGKKRLRNGTLIQFQEKKCVGRQISDLIADGHLEATCLHPPLVICRDLFAITTSEGQNASITKKEEKTIAQGFSWWVYFIIVFFFFLLILGILYWTWWRRK